MKWMYLFLLLGAAISPFAQEPIQDKKKCAPGKQKFKVLSKDTIDQISYKKLALQINCDLDSGRVTMIHSILSNGSTLKRFKDENLTEFEEILPLIGIADWQLIVRINQMITEDKREDEYKRLVRTYRQMSPHLFGVYSEGYALVKTIEGYNFIDKSGQLLFACYFENATNFMDGYAYVKQSGIWYLIDASGVFYSVPEASTED